jgi:hypothetical protein
MTALPQSIYRFGEPEIHGDQLNIQRNSVSIPGYRDVSLKTEFDY